MTYINGHIGIRKVIQPTSGDSGNTSDNPLYVEVTNTVDVNITDTIAIPVSFDSRITQYCLDGTYDGADAIIRYWDDGKIEYCLLSGGDWTLVVDQKLLTCQRTIAATKIYFETVRLSSDLTSVAKSWIPEIPAGILTAQQGVPGKTYTIAGGYKAFLVRWQRETEEGAILDINGAGISDGFGYIAGQGCLYMQDLIGVDSNTGETYCQPITFDAVGPAAYIELLIVRSI